MNKVEIAEYKGWLISFDTAEETFYCQSEEYDHGKKKKSFAACKTYIDDFLKANAVFNSFVIEGVPDAMYQRDKHLKVIGIRADGRFVAEDEKGDKKQISEYNERDYMLINEENAALWQQLKDNSEAQDELRIKRKEIVSMFKVKTLTEVRKELMKK